MTSSVSGIRRASATRRRAVWATLSAFAWAVVFLVLTGGLAGPVAAAPHGHVAAHRAWSGAHGGARGTHSADRGHGLAIRRDTDNGAAVRRPLAAASEQSQAVSPAPAPAVTASSSAGSSPAKGQALTPRSRQSGRVRQASVVSKSGRGRQRAPAALGLVAVARTLSKGSATIVHLLTTAALSGPPALAPALAPALPAHAGVVPPSGGVIASAVQLRGGMPASPRIAVAAPRARRTLPTRRVALTVTGNGSLALAGGPWEGASLRAATHLAVPIFFGAVVLCFIVAQALIDRRDPKMARAPARGDDDSVGFT